MHIENFHNPRFNGCGLSVGSLWKLFGASRDNLKTSIQSPVLYAGLSSHSMRV
jgi:hypothetical protein